MFDSLHGRDERVGSLTSLRKNRRQQLESLEDRAVPAVIAGNVYGDANANGTQNNGETGIGGSTIDLTDSQGTILATTTTNANGFYQFDDSSVAQPGPRQLSYEANFPSTKTDLSRSASVQMFDPSMGTLTKVELIATGELSSRVQLENLALQTASAKTELEGSMTFQVGNQTLSSGNLTRELQTTLNAFDGTPDLSGTSAHDFGQTTLSGSFNSLSITNPADMQAFMGTGLLNVSQNANMSSCSCGTGNLMSMAETMTSGQVKVVYHFTPSTNLGPGTYTVVQRTQPPTYVDGQETRDNLTPIPGTHLTDRIEVQITSTTQQSTTNNFGELQASSIAGTVYHDRDQSGTRNSADRGIGNVTLTLSGTDVFGAIISRSTTTNSSGQYQFANLTPGTYQILEVQPAGYLDGVNKEGSLGGTVVGDTINNITVEANENGTDYDFGEVRTTPPDPITPTTPSKYFLILR